MLCGWTRPTRIAKTAGKGALDRRPFAALQKNAALPKELGYYRS
jgi:hypothetical protein